MTPPRRNALLGALIAVALGLGALPRLEVELDISRFMLGEEVGPAARLSKALAQSDLSNTLIVAVGAPEEAEAIATADRLLEALRATPELEAAVDQVTSGPPEGIQEAMWSLYRPRILSFVASSTAGAAAAASEAGLSDALDETLYRLSTPASTVVAKVLAEDPLLVLLRLFEGLSDAAGGGLRLRAGHFIDAEGRAILFVRTVASAFDGGAQAKLLSGLREAFARVAPAEATLELAGLHRFSARMEASIKADIQRVSILSTLAMVALVLILFRSPRVLGLTAAVIGFGFLCGLFTTVWAFGRIHGLTLAFGASLIGVSIDYCIHYFVHFTLEPKSPRALMRELGPGLALGALTTVVGFVALAVAGLPGLRQVAVFSAAGILGALAGTFLFLPAGVSKQGHTETTRWVAERLGRGVERARRWPKGVLLGFPAAAVGLAVVGIPQVRLERDISRLARLDPELVAEEEAIRGAVSPYDRSRLVVATGSTAAAALEVNDRVAEVLSAAREAGALERFRNVASLLPSPRLQLEVAKTFREQPGLAERLSAVAEAKGFEPETFSPFVDALERDLPDPLDYAALANSPLRPLVEGFRAPLPDGVGFMSLLGGVTRPEAVAADIEAIPGAYWVEQAEIYSEANARYQGSTLWSLLVGWVFVVACVVLRYRSLGPAAASLVPATLAVAATAGFLGWVGQPIDLVALTALLMVFSMGVDYGVFVAEAQWARPEAVAGTLTAVVVAWLSTLAGFGLLALSEQPTMRTIGLVAAVGLSTTVWVMPTVLLWTGARREG